MHKKSGIKSKYDDEILDELKKQSFTNNASVHLNKKITELKGQNKKQVLYIFITKNNFMKNYSSII